MALVVMALPGLASTPVAAATGGYSEINLGTLPGGSDSFARAINAAGVVAGFSNGPGISGIHATAWQPDVRGGFQAIDLTPNLPDDRSSDALAINSAGVIVGDAMGSDNNTHAAVWRPVTGGPASGARTAGLTRVSYQEITLPELPGDDASDATGINARGVVVGSSFDTHGSVAHPTEWRPNGRGYTAVQLDTLTASQENRAVAVNQEGVIAGSVSLPEPSTNLEHAAIWTPTPEHGAALTDLGTLPDGNLSDAVAINAAGQVVGFASSDAVANEVPVVWHQTGPGAYSASILPGPNGVAAGLAWAISPTGQIAGGFVVLSGFAVEAALWTPSRNGYGLTLLRPQPGWAWSTARGINPAGFVVGSSSSTDRLTDVATLWRPAS